MISSVEIMDALQKDARFIKLISENPQELTALYAEFVNDAPVLLAEFLPRELSFDSLSRTRAVFLRHMLMNGFPNKMASIMAGSNASIADLAEAQQEVEFRLKFDISTALTATMVDEIEIQIFGLAGFKTIEDVMRTFPSLLLFP